MTEVIPAPSTEYERLNPRIVLTQLRYKTNVQRARLTDQYPLGVHVRRYGVRQVVVRWFGSSEDERATLESFTDVLIAGGYEVVRMKEGSLHVNSAAQVSLQRERTNREILLVKRPCEKVVLPKEKRP